MNLSYHYPILFWNTANLIIDSGANFLTQEEEEELIEIDVDGKATTSDYGKIASAIGRMQQKGVKVLPPDINLSSMTFTPDPATNVVRYGLQGLTGIGESIVRSLIQNRPYVDMDDLLSKVKLTKPQVVTLIKSGALDSFGDRTKIMTNYIESIAEVKKTLNLRNVQMLIRYDLLPRTLLDMEIRVFNFNKYLRKGYDKSGKIVLDSNALPFYEEHFDMDKLIVSDTGTTFLPEPYWKSIYDSYMNKVRAYIKQNLEDLLHELNTLLIDEVWDKYGRGNLAKWSMDSVNFYQDKHELDGVDMSDWGVVDFWDLPEEPTVKSSFRSKQGHLVKLFHLHKIAGTVIDKDPLKSQITLLTTKGVVIVQAYGVMQVYDKQISEPRGDGTKRVVEKSWFTRGTKIIVMGMRRGHHTFIAKKYRNMVEDHHFMKITRVTEDNKIEVQEERVEVAEQEG